MYPRFLFTLALLFGFSSVAHAQLTIRINSLPPETPPGATIYATHQGFSDTARVNYADPDLAFRLVNGKYYCTYRDTITKPFFFEISRGTAATRACLYSGTIQWFYGGGTPAGQPDTITRRLFAWADTIPWPNPRSTASPSVSIFVNKFAAPQLRDTIKIWQYLPLDYATSTKRYPVIYMFNGKELFDASLTDIGEWGVDEILDADQGSGGYGCIVIACEVGYSLAEKLLDFVDSTLKPYVDGRLRTKPDSENTAIVGHVNYANTALYAAFTRPQVFGKAGVIEPSYTPSGDAPIELENLLQLASTHRPNFGSRIAFQGSSYGLPTDTIMIKFARILSSRGYVLSSAGQIDTVNLRSLINFPAYYRLQFPRLYKFLFPTITAADDDFNEAGHTFSLWPNPGEKESHVLNVRLASSKGGQLLMHNMQGQIVLRKECKMQEHVMFDTRALSKGIYSVSFQSGTRKQTKRWVKQ